MSRYGDLGIKMRFELRSLCDQNEIGVEVNV